MRGLFFCLLVVTPVFAGSPFENELRRYEAYRVRGLAARAEWKDFTPSVGWRVTARDRSGNAAAGTLRVLSDNAGNRISVIAEGREFPLHAVPGTPYFEGEIRPLRHAMPYRLRLDGREVVDPAANAYTAEGPLQAMFWDFDRPDAYHRTAPVVDLRERPLIAAESDVYGLVQRWPAFGRIGPARRGDTYRFIAESGVIDELKRMGYNAVEFLPWNQSVDGENWQSRYLVFGLFAPDARHGSPDDFARMLDAFNRAGIAVIHDAVIGHYPDHGNSGGANGSAAGAERDLARLGLQEWIKGDGRKLFGDVRSPWSTLRYDYANPYIRRWLIDAELTNLKYGAGGVRVDNFDGIRLYEGPGGGGPQFLKELAGEIRRYQPQSVLIAEMFFGHREVMQALDRDGFGFQFRNHSDLFDVFKDNLQKRTDELNVAALRGALRGPWSWGETPRLQYLTNHDEAGNPRGNATGAYPASLIKGKDTPWYYVESKTRAFGALAMLSGSAYLDLPQQRLLQEGSFSADPAIDWSLRGLASQNNASLFFAGLSRLVDSDPAFAFRNQHPDIENHVDYDNKVISLLRVDFATGRRTYAVVNLGDHDFPRGYAFGAEDGRYRIAFASDLQTGEVSATAEPMHQKAHRLTVPRLPPYGVIVLQQR